MGRPSKYAPKLRDRAVWMVHEHADEYPSQWSAIRSVAGKTRMRHRSAAPLDQSEPHSA
jgi:hypothetical protein